MTALGVDVRVGDYDDPEALGRAFAGVDRALLVASNDPEPRVQQHQNVVVTSLQAEIGCSGSPAGRCATPVAPATAS